LKRKLRRSPSFKGRAKESMKKVKVFSRLVQTECSRRFCSLYSLRSAGGDNTNKSITLSKSREYKSVDGDLKHTKVLDRLIENTKVCIAFDIGCGNRPVPK